MLVVFLFSGLFLGFESFCWAENGYSSPAQVLVANRDIRKEAESITSIEQIKKTLRQLMRDRGACGMGSCHDSTSISICDYIALVDIRLEGALGFGMMSSVATFPDFTVSKEDVALLKRIGNSCKMTSYQYWNSPWLTHVHYNPSDEDSGWINKALGLEK